jgi:hypothetical protein
MKCEMQNFIKFNKSRKKVSDVGQSDKPKSKRDDWKRERKIARKNKSQQRKLAS